MLTEAGHRAVLGSMIGLALAAAILGLLAAPGDGASEVSTRAPATTVDAPPAQADVDAGPPTTTRPAAAPTTTAAPPTTVAPSVSVPIGAVGAFTVAAGESPVVGTGPVTTYTVEVEDALGYSADEAARIVDATLADPRSWTADGAVGFQRVASGGAVRLVLATPATVDQLCLPLDTAGIFSCHQGGTVALNSDRWFQGTEDWPGDVDQYRAYVVNHEMGHAIGHGHVSCGGPGQVAPVMMQQSKGLDGCLANGWPFP